jgi:hypothetical protein
MYNAPSVSYPVGRCAFYGWGLVGLGAAGWVAFGAMQAMAAMGRSAPLTVWQTVVGVALCAAWAGMAAWHWHRSLQGRLHWDALGTSRVREASPGLWRWQPAGRVRGKDLIQVITVLDLQSRCLLRVRCSDGGAYWLWVECAQDPDRWDDLRRALVAAR